MPKSVSSALITPGIRSKQYDKQRRQTDRWASMDKGCEDIRQWMGMGGIINRVNLIAQLEGRIHRRRTDDWCLRRNVLGNKRKIWGKSRIERDWT